MPGCDPDTTTIFSKVNVGKVSAPRKKGPTGKPKCLSCRALKQKVNQLASPISEKCHFGPTASKCDRCARTNRDCGPPLLPMEDQVRRQQGARKRLARRIHQILEAGVSEQTIDIALVDLLPKPTEATGSERSIPGEINVGSLPSNSSENTESLWVPFGDIDQEFLYSFLGM